MKFYLGALVACGIFVVAALLVIDAATHVFGKPARGVSYGISVYWLGIALALVGSGTLLGVRRLGRSSAIVTGTIGVVVSVLLLLPQPQIDIRLLVALIIASVLSVCVLLVSRISIDRQAR